MTLLAAFLNAIAAVLEVIFQFATLIVIVQAIISWVNPDPSNPIVRFLHGMTEPLLRPLRRYIPLVGGRLDLSPLVLLLVIIFLQSFLLQALRGYAIQLQRAALGA
jgi:YggT family protein